MTAHHNNRVFNLCLMLLFSLSLFTSAALMFSVQPMVGKMLLPIVGGTPAGWIVAMAFFQLALLAGYTLAYGFSRLPARGHAIAYILTLGLGVVFLPVAISAQDTADTLDASGTFMLLAVTVGVPFIALSTTSTTLQRLFSATSHPAAHDPYFLYAASNLGSFGGLLLYPLLIEPNLTLGQQSESWFCFYAGLMALAVMCLLSLGARSTQTQKVDDSAATVAPLDLKRCLTWVAYAFIPASLLMGYTGFITRDIYSAPLIWVLPLSIYLLTFVLAFRSPALLSARSLLTWHTIAVALSLVLIVLSTSVMRTSLQPVILHLLALGIIAMVFHLRLYEDRPLGSGRQLGAFYLLISLGGALAGVFNAFVAPVIFNASLELPLVLLASLLLHPEFRHKLKNVGVAALAFSILTVVTYILAAYFDPKNARAMILMGVLSLVLTAVHPRALMIAGAMVFVTHYNVDIRNVIAKHRNFYGNTIVYESDETDKKTGVTHRVRSFNHGTTLHGFQVLDEEHRLNPTSYYMSVRRFFEINPPLKAVVMGLGAGTMHCLAKPETDMTFIEIDPAVIDTAQKYFTYLKDCQPGKTPRILQGDGRLEFAKLKDEKFNLIAIDVFSSDYIPAHLMTREALQLYRDRLADGGIILFHISNIFYDLSPVLVALAEDVGLDYRLQEVMRPEAFHERPSRWFIIGTPAALARYDNKVWTKPQGDAEIAMWTDDFTDYISIMNEDVFAFKRWVKPKKPKAQTPSPQQIPAGK